MRVSFGLPVPTPIRCFRFLRSLVTFLGGEMPTLRRRTDLERRPWAACVLGASLARAFVWGLWVGWVLLVDAAAAEEPPRPRIEIGWTAAAPAIDGRLEEGEWTAAAHVDGLTQALPDPGVPATQRTEVWIMTDEDHLYIAARLWDTDPSEIVASAMQRDGNTRRDDRFGFTIDPFLDRQNGYFFQVNPNGVRTDFLLEGGQGERSWDGRWYAKASVDAEGWTVEIALPYATISFDPEGDVWGFNMARGIRRRDEIDRWSDPVRERFLTAMGRAGDLVGMKGVRLGVGLRAIPSTTLRRVDDANPPPPEQDDGERHYTRLDPSFDAFYKVTPSVTTALTVNTDFGETEVDERRVNLSRFALFFPEKRDFFLQDALIFGFGDLNENGRPFFSRRIGLDEAGEPVGILAGGKVTGRIGDVKIGVLDVVLDERDRVDQTNLLVARVARNLGESTLGAIVTNGDPDGNGDNTLGGLDFIYRNSDFRGGKTLRASAWGQATYNDPDKSPGEELDATRGMGYAFGGKVEYPNDEHNWRLVAGVFDDDFDPALGFVNRVGIREYRGHYRRRWRPSIAGIQTVDSRVSGLVVTEQGRSVESAGFVWRAIDVKSPIDDGIRLEYEHRYEAVDVPFSNFSVPFGRYHFDRIGIRIETSANRPLSGAYRVDYGTFYDGNRLRASADLDLRITKHVQVGVDYIYDNLRLPGGDENIHLLRARLSLLFTPDVSWVTLLQYDNVSDAIGVNSRFRWIIEDGREVFLVLNQGFETRDEIRPARTAPLAKLKWTFRF